MGQVDTAAELRREATSTLHEWMEDYTSPWADGKQRKILCHKADYDAATLLLEAREVYPSGAQPSHERWEIEVKVRRVQ